MRKIYIAGKITGLPTNQVTDKFNSTEEYIKSLGLEAVNPIKISPFNKTKKWVDYMEDCIKALFECDAIYLQKDWKHSKGARIEFQIAVGLNLTVITEINQ